MTMQYVGQNGRLMPRRCTHEFNLPVRNIYEYPYRLNVDYGRSARLKFHLSGRQPSLQFALKHDNQCVNIVYIRNIFDGISTANKTESPSPCLDSREMSTIFEHSFWVSLSNLSSFILFSFTLFAMYRYRVDCWYWPLKRNCSPRNTLSHCSRVRELQALKDLSIRTK